MLQDDALIQTSYDVRDDEVVAHRLCYYPCPFDLTEWDVGSAGGVLDAVEMLTDSVADGNDDLQLVRFQGPVRFGFDIRDRRPVHECSHLHLASADCRLPVFGPVSAGQFFRFLLRSFYLLVWLDNEEAQGWSTDHLGQNLSEESRTDMFMERHDRL